MNELSDKAKIIYATLEMLEAKDSKSGVTSYAILDYISENEEVQEHPLLKEIEEEDFVNIIMELNIKSINTLVASMCRKGMVEKTDARSMVVDGQRRNLRLYYIK